jgi:transposase
MGEARQQAGRQGPSRTLEDLDVHSRPAVRSRRGALSLRWPINGERFLAYVKTFLIPTLKPNDIVVADNLGSHKGKAVRNAIRAAGARLLFLPKYSPDLNPIEQVFAKVKTLVRKAEPRTFDAISEALKSALAQVPPSECANYLRNAGYAHT